MLKVSLCHRLEVLKNLYIFLQKLFLSSRDGLVHWMVILQGIGTNFSRSIKWWNGITIPIRLFGVSIVLEFWIGIPFPHFWPSLHVILVELDPSVDKIVAPLDLNNLVLAVYKPYMSILILALLSGGLVTLVLLSLALLMESISPSLVFNWWRLSEIRGSGIDCD